MTNATAPIRTMSATLTAALTDPQVNVDLGGASMRLPVDLGRVTARSTGPLLFAVVREAVRLLRRHTGCAPEGRWVRLDESLGTLTVGLQEIPGRCATCVHGCDCKPGSDGCAHLNCRFVQAPAMPNGCPGAALLTGPALRSPAARSRRAFG